MKYLEHMLLRKLEQNRHAATAGKAIEHMANLFKWKKLIEQNYKPAWLKNTSNIY